MAFGTPALKVKAMPETHESQGIPGYPALIQLSERSCVKKEKNNSSETSATILLPFNYGGVLPQTFGKNSNLELSPLQSQQLTVRTQ